MEMQPEKRQLNPFGIHRHNSSQQTKQQVYSFTHMVFNMIYHIPGNEMLRTVTGYMESWSTSGGPHLVVRRQEKLICNSGWRKHECRQPRQGKISSWGGAQ